jgi:hypothetical protein
MPTTRQGLEVSPSNPRPKQKGPISKYPTVSAKQIVGKVLWRLAQADKRMLAHRLWLGAKVVTFPQISIDDLPGVNDTLVTGWPGRIDALVLAALAANLKCGTFFEFGTFRGRTTWTVVHNNPTITAFSLDLAGPQALKDAELELTDPYLFESWRRGEAIAGTPEATRITLLTGDSAQFDYGPYRNQIDLVYVDGSHSYSYVRSDTKSALSLLSAIGTIVWDDCYYPGVWKYLHEINGTLPLSLIANTGMVVHSRHPAMAGVIRPSATRAPTSTRPPAPGGDVVQRLGR